MFPNLDPFMSMAARVAETALALEDLAPPHPLVPSRPTRRSCRCARAPAGPHGCTEAPRGTLYHRYDVADDGTILEAKIVPPTSQNLRHMERDLREFLPWALEQPEEELTRLCEMVVRNYDPCISCATHFLRVDVERV